MKNNNCDRKSSCDDFKHNHCEGCGGNKPKGDLISREALKRKLNKKAFDLANGGMIFIESINHIIDNAPIVSIDWGSDDGERTVYTRPQGEWIEVEPTEEDKEYGFDTRIVCSRCYEPDSHFDFDEYYKPKAVWYFRPKFCPNCGADMRGDNNEID